MGKSIEFDPLGTFVASKARTLTLASKEYQLGDTIDKSTINRRKLQQLWSQGRIAYAWMLKKNDKADAPVLSDAGDGTDAAPEAGKVLPSVASGSSLRRGGIRGKAKGKAISGAGEDAGDGTDVDQSEDENIGEDE